MVKNSQKEIKIDKRYYNKDHIIYYEIKDYYQTELYLYNKKGYFQYYSTYDSDKYSAEDLNEKGLFVKDFKVYCKPHVFLYLSNGVEKKVNFKTVEECKEYVKNLNLDQSKFI